MRIARARDGNPGGFRRLELVALALDPLQNLPARKGKAVALGERVGVARDRVHVLVVGGKDGQDVVGLLGDRAQRFDEAVLVVERIGREAWLRIA